MNKIFEKRNTLEQFIREQTIGPGIAGYRYIDIDDVMLTQKSIAEAHPIDYHNEILDIVPAAIYSTGILFPEDSSGTSRLGVSRDVNEYTDPDGQPADASLDENTEDDIDTSDPVELNQMFPKTMGFSCCLDEKCLLAGTIAVKVSFRYYRKIKQDRKGKFNERYGVLCEIDKDEVERLLNIYSLNQFSLRTVYGNNVLLLSKQTIDQLKALKFTLLNIQKSAAAVWHSDTVRIVPLTNLKVENTYLSNLKSSIYYELKNTIHDNSKKIELYKITQKIELFENFTDHLKNLIDINLDGYGIWQSESVQKIIIIDNIDFPKDQRKKVFLYNKDKEYSETITVFGNGSSEKKGLKDICLFDVGQQQDFASLSVNLQLTRDSRRDKGSFFLKVQIVNTSSPYDEGLQNRSRYYSTFNELVNQKCFFGVNASITSEYLVPYNNQAYGAKNGMFDEDTTTQFIYSQYNDFGIGHGCSVKWDNMSDVQTIQTEYIPACEIPDVDPIPRDKTKAAVLDRNGQDFVAAKFLTNTKVQEFKWLSKLSDASDEEIVASLLSFIDAYGSWISNKRKKYQGEFVHIATQELDKCEKDYRRMRKNVIQLLSGNENTEHVMSFRLMNTAMFIQLWHSIKVKEDGVRSFFNDEAFKKFDFDFYRTHASDRLFPTEESASWRAFQLAFILLNLDGIFQLGDDPQWEARNNLVDLVWFPTGGGKTEAYLGLIALTIINRRRLTKESGGGTAAIMRYTLRLLTMQQFQRATMMVMALEQLRRWDMYGLGAEPITIGLWVGDKSLPNRIEDLLVEFNNLSNGRSNKIPFSNCPWCGSELRPCPTGNAISNRNDVYNFNKVHLFCDNNKCSYTEADFFDEDISKGPIPVNLCDESIYQQPPTLLFGTVDKFAQLAHKVNGNANDQNSDSRRIFGKGTWEAGKPVGGYLPPDLIIQDELHLLLGPLGSAVALFETAVDQLCTSENGRRPKIISSTATTRNTQLQIAAIFDREVNLFPKPGVECDDSFFAFYRRVFTDAARNGEQFLSKRKYLGILPTGRTQIWMQMRLAAIIMTHRAIFELRQLENASPLDFEQYETFEKAMDFYHTIISYFNSLKEVGKTQSQVQTYILKEVRRVFTRVVRPQKLMHALYTYGPMRESELTGRLSGEEVKNELENVEETWRAKNRFAWKQETETVRGKVPPEFVVATNMISVGIDVSRFNLIIMNSMPRNTAEYIQASSRVARNNYGLVLTVHHPFRARDISHYEKFIEFHEKMYSYVEPISITPFTKKAIDRYMGLYLATMIRHQVGFIDRDSADRISSMSELELKKMADDLASYFLRRQERSSRLDDSLKGLITKENVEYIESWILKAIFDWKEQSDKALTANMDFVFNNKAVRSTPSQEQLYVDVEEYEANIHSKKWQIPMSLRVIEPEAAVKIYPK
ncbi:hypothetical protein LZD49_32945 [Dyadobacter sp. CY261]|uniref:helicase-related protein n=1 Tax=Dyadobacter sp. CY261 TaxID=2907203 RepID=UPI001F1B6B17|nr:helicase-related protein [Dyadobacter sp. CY261]MCF0075332.1 hypothetical protein [Dyadobacter sp. CY261]